MADDAPEVEIIRVVREGSPAELGDEKGEWKSYVCGARGWNYVTIDWSDVEIFVSDIKWNNGHRDITYLGAPGKNEGIKFGRHDKTHIWITAQSEDKAQRYWGHGSGKFSIGLQDYGNDNSGGYIVWVRRTP